jgi:branched-chain amino acid transport system ATP-binding protein
MNVLTLEHVALSFGGLQVLKDIAFSLGAGEKVALIGPNGAGKTTVLNVITGLLSPLSGKVILGDRDVTHVPPHARTALGMARSFQITSLFPALTVMSNVLLALHGTKKSSYQVARTMYGYRDQLQKAEGLLESIDLLSKRDTITSSLSHGEQRRLEIVLALAPDPTVLLLDEPTAGLTTNESAELAQMLRGPSYRDIGLLFVAHDLDLVFGVAERILVLYYGTIIAEGTPTEIQHNPSVREVYLGESTSA